MSLRHQQLITNTSDGPLKPLCLNRATNLTAKAQLLKKILKRTENLKPFAVDKENVIMV